MSFPIFFSRPVVAEPSTPSTDPLETAYQKARAFISENYQKPALDFLNDLTTTQKIADEDFSNYEIDLLAAYFEDVASEGNSNGAHLRTEVALANPQLSDKEVRILSVQLFTYFERSLTDCTQSDSFKKYKLDSTIRIDPAAQKLAKTCLQTEPKKNQNSLHPSFMPSDLHMLSGIDKVRKFRADLQAQANNTSNTLELISLYAGDQTVRTQIYNAMGIKDNLIGQLLADNHMTRPQNVTETDWQLANTIAGQQLEKIHAKNFWNYIGDLAPIVGAAIVSALEPGAAPATLSWTSIGLRGTTTAVGVGADYANYQDANNTRLAWQGVATSLALKNNQMNNTSVQIISTQADETAYGAVWNIASMGTLFIPSFGKGIFYSGVLQGGLMSTGHALARTGFNNQDHANDLAQLAGTTPNNVKFDIFRAGVFGALVGGFFYSLALLLPPCRSSTPPAPFKLKPEPKTELPPPTKQPPTRLPSRELPTEQPHAG